MEKNKYAYLGEIRTRKPERLIAQKLFETEGKAFDWVEAEIEKSKKGLTYENVGQVQRMKIE